MKEHETLLDQTVTVIRSHDGSYIIFSPSNEDGSDKKEPAEQENIHDHS